MNETLEDKTCNGWKNYETWNVALWLQNDEGLYLTIMDNLVHGITSWLPLRDTIIESSQELHDDMVGKAFPDYRPGTPDGVRWDDERVDVAEIEGMILEIYKGMRKH